MPAVSVLLFSVLKQRIGKTRITLDIVIPTTAEAVLDAVAQLHPAAASLRPVMRLAVNQVYVGESDPVTEGDELAIVTPVSGG